MRRTERNQRDNQGCSAPLAIAQIACYGALSVLVPVLVHGCAECEPDQEEVFCYKYIVESLPDGRIIQRHVVIPACEPPGCHPGYTTIKRLSQIPRPDLSYTNLDGVVDFGVTTLLVEADDGDVLETKLMGRVAIADALCPSDSPTPCLLNLVLVELEPVDKTLTTSQGRTVTDVFARNANLWTGTRLPDGSIDMDSSNELALEATIKGEKRARVLNVNAFFEGKLEYNVPRLTNTGPRTDNRIDIVGNFADDDFTATLSIRIWLTDCRPGVEPSVKCVSIEPETPVAGRYLRFSSTYRNLGNMQASQDLCDALLYKTKDRCEAGGSLEFPTFTCKEEPLPTDPVEVAKMLKFTWRDAKGRVLGNQHQFYLGYMPPFPVTLTVENKWGKQETSVIYKKPEGACPGPLLWFAGYLSGVTPRLDWGNRNWISKRDSSAGRFDIGFSEDSFDFFDTATLATPTFPEGMSGFCTTRNENDMLVVVCHDDSGHPVVPAGVGFMCFGGSSEVAGAAFGVLMGDGRKQSGTEDWTSRFNPNERQYEIVFRGDRDETADYVTVVTPSFDDGATGFCATRSDEGDRYDIAIRCLDSDGRPTRPLSLSFLCVKNPKSLGVASGVVSGSGERMSGTSNWRSAFDRSSEQYEIAFAEDAYMHAVAVVTPCFAGDESGFCVTRRIGDRLGVQCYDHNGEVVRPASFAFVSYPRR